MNAIETSTQRIRDIMKQREVDEETRWQITVWLDCVDDISKVVNTPSLPGEKKNG